MQIGIGSLNPAKIKAVQSAFEKNGYQCMITGVNVPSGVSEMPFNDDETIEGAIGRASRSLIETKSNLAIGLEGGVMESKNGLLLTNWGALVEEGKKPIIAGGARIILPDEISNRLRSGEELGPVMNDFANRHDVRTTDGAIGVFSNGRIKRDDMFAHVVHLLIGQWEYQSKGKMMVKEK
jgi:inosine/xanthosine triphosphatase